MRTNVTCPSTVPAATGFTVIFVVDAALLAPRLSVTLRENVSVAALVETGAVNVGCAAVVLESVTDVPPVCVQEYVATVPSESVPVPLNVTVAPPLTVCAGPAFATGGTFGGGAG